MAIQVTASTNATTKVTQLYVAMFGRAPDIEGLNFWGGALDAGQSVAKVAQDMFSTTPARAYFPAGSTSQEVVQSFYVNVLGRQPDADGLAFWVARLDALKATGNTNAVGQVVTEIINIVTSYTGNDPAGVESAQLFANKIEVANFWVSENGNVLDSAKPIVLVNSDPASVNQVKAQILNGFGDIVADTTFTLKEIYTETTVVVGPEVERVVMWGYNPHAHGETGVDNLDGDNPDGNDNNLTNEGPADGGVPVSFLYDYLETVAGLNFVQLGLIDVVDGVYATVDGLTITQNGDGTQTITVTLPNGTVNTAEVALGELYFKLVYNALIDSEGNSRLYEVVRAADPNDVGSTVTVRNYTPIKLTTAVNNGGTIEQGYTTAGDDLIVAGRLDLLHGAYIDGGAGRNTLEVDAKGTYAQPLAVLNVQEIHVQNLPNVYTGGTGGYLGDSNYPGLGNGSGSSDSVLDLSRAVDIDRLVVTEGSGTGAALGDLTIVGVRNGATLRLEGGFTQDVTVHYGQGLTGPLTVELLLGQVTGSLNFVHNTDALHLVSLGGVANSFGSEDIGGRLTHLKISGDAALFINGDLDDSFQDETPVTIDASANTKGVDLTLSGSEKVTFIGSLGNDRFQVATSDDSSDVVGVGPNDDVVTIVGSNGNNHFEVSATTLHVTAGNGNNNVEVAGRFGDVTLGNGNNSVYADSDEGFETLAVTVGDGNNIIRAEGSETVTITAGDGANRIDADTSANVSITAGDGGNTVTAVNTQSASVTTGEGNDKITASAATIVIDSGAGNDVVTVAGIAGELSQSAAAGLNLMLILDDSGSMGGSRITALKSGLNGMLDGLVADGVNAATITVVFTSTATASAWGTIDQARAVIDSMAASGGTNYAAALAEAMTGWNTTGKIVGANNVSVFVSDADSALDPTVASDWQDFLVDNSIVSYAVGLDVSTDAGLAQVAYNGQTNSDMSAILTDANGLAQILDNIGESLVGTSGKQALVTIDLGAGQNTLHLGDADQLAQGLVALEGSSITGENITMVVNANSDLRAAALSGISKVVLDNADVGSADRTVDNGMLTITASQFVDIGAANFSVEGSIFHTHGTIKIIVEEDISLTSINVNSLPRNIDLLIEINDGATLTMTAEQLHKWVAANGVTLADDGNTDEVGGKVIITGGGENFDPFNTSDTVKTSIGGNIYYGGSLSDDFSAFNVTVNGGYGGYDRPSDTPNQVVWTIDGDQFPVVGAVSTWNYNIEIIGENDITFTGALNAGLVQGVNTTPFTVDFSQLEGVANGLTLGNFEHVGAVYGNSNNGYESTVLVELDHATDKTVGAPGEGNGLVSSGVTEYVVTKIGGPTAPDSVGNTAIIYLCDTTQDLEVIALRGNWNDTLQVEGAAWGLAFELQGGGTAKAEGPTGTSNVGTLDADYMWGGADAVVNIVHANAGDVRPIHVEGINITNADTLAINVAGTAIIDTLTTNAAESLTVDATGSVTLVDTLTLGTLDTIDASGVVGTFGATLSGAASGDDDFSFTGSTAGSSLTLLGFTADNGAADGTTTTIDGGVGGVTLTIGNGAAAGSDTVSLSAATLTNVTAVVLTQGSVLTLTIAQAGEIGAAAFSTPGTATATLNLTNLDDTLFVKPAFASDITVAVVDVAPLPVVTLNAATNLTGISALNVYAGTTLNLTAAQFQQLAGTGTIAGIAATTDFVVNITGLTAADLVGGFSLAGIPAGVEVNLQLAESVDLSGSTLTGVDSITFGDDITLTLGDVQQANGVDIVGGANSVLKFTDTASGAFESINASGFDVTELHMLNVLVDNRNIDLLFSGLAQSITKVIYNDLGWVEGVTQTVNITVGTTVPGFVVFNKPEDSVEIRNFVLNLQGGTEIDGNLRLSSSEKNDDLIRTHLQSVVINSTGTGVNLLTGSAANVIDGQITSQGTGSQGSYNSVDNNLLNITINATQALTVTGAVVFESVTGDDDITANDNDAAIATLTVNGSANVNLGGLDTTDDDVDGLIVTNAGTGTLSATVDGNAIDQATGNNDALSFLGSNIALTIVNSVNLSDDVITGVSQITLVDANSTVLTLTQAQFDTLGAANLVATNTNAGQISTLHLVAFGSAPFDATTVDADINVGNLTLVPGAVTLDPATNLTGVDAIIVQNGSVLNLTAAQFQQLQAAGSINAADALHNFTVNITGLTQADVNAGFSLAAIGTTGNATITLTLAEDVNLVGTGLNATLLGDLNDLTVILAAGQTIGLGNETQSDGLNVNGGANSTIVFQYAPHTSFPGQVDASGYNVTTLKALANGFTTGGNSNVEYSIDDLPSAVILRLYADPADLGFLDPTYRVVVIEEGITTPTGLIFNDWDDTDEVRTLTLTLEGGVELNGNLSIPTRTDKDGDLTQQYFNLLTINSEGAQANVIGGNINTATVLGAPNTSNNNLLNVVINAAQDLVVEGDIVFNSIDVPLDNAVANLTVTGAGNVSIEQLNVLDDDIDVLNVANNGTGTLTVTGASPAIDGDASIETINLSGTGDIVFGVHPDVGVVTEWGISAAGLSTLNASALTGDLTLGEVRDVDSANFTFTAGSGVTKLTLSADTLNATQVTDTGWTFDFTTAAVGSEFHLGSLTQGAPTFTDGPLTINLGANTTLYIDKNTNLTGIDLTLLQTLDIVLADGVTLTLTAAQANGLNIVAGADTGAPGFTGVVNVTQLGTAAYDLSGISADIAGTVTLASNDVTLNAATDLGDFSVTLTSLTNTDLSGQTIRFQNVDQAGREIIVSDVTGPGTNSSNVVWLFNSVTGPVNTDGYDADLGRLWINQTLANGANIEDLFTTLPASVVRVEFSSIEFVDAMLTSADVNRVVELVAHTNLAAGLTFSDSDRLEHLNTLTLKMGGSVNVAVLNLDNIVVPAANVGGISFDKLTINSERALHQDHYLAPELYINDNDGVNEEGEHVAPANLNVIGNITIGANNGLDLLNVELNTGALSTVGTGLAGSQGANLQVGTITFDSEVAASTALLTVTGANTTTIASLNTADADITGLTITNSGSGTLTVTGASPAAAVSNTETLTINATGDVVLGTAGDATKPGVSGADLSLIDVNGSGNVDLGVIALVDGNDFTLDTEGSTGDVTAVLDGATLNAAGEWTIEGSWTGGTLNVTLKDTVTLGAGTLTIDDAVITISGNVNLTTLADLDIVDLSDVTFIVPTGNSLTILAEDADGLTVTGGGVVTITELEATPGADFANVMTTDGDTGTVEVLVTTDVLTPVNFTGDMGKAHVTVSGNGVFDVTGASSLNSVVFDHDGIVGTPEVSVMSSYTVGAAATLVLTAAQGDDRTVNGAGTTNVEDIGIYAGVADMSLAGVASATVNIAVDTPVTLNSADNLGAAGAGRVTTIAAGVTLTSAGSVVNGQYIVGEDATLLVDDENTLPTETPITANLSNVTVEFITLVDTAIAGTITFPALYGSPAAKDLDPLVAVQTVEMTAAQASGQTINGAGAGTQGEVIVNALGAGFTNLSNIDVGRATAYVPAVATLHAGTTLGEFAVVLDGVDVDLTLTAAQADGRSITDTLNDGDSVTVTALHLTPAADLSAVDVDTETALLDANGGVTLTANLGTGFTVIITDTSEGADTVTFDGTLNPNGTGAGTTFVLEGNVGYLVENALTLVFQNPDDADLVTVTEANVDSTVIVNNVDGGKVDLSGITADSMVANVPADAVMHAGTDFGGFVVRLAEGADITMTYDQFLDVAGDGALAAGDFDSAAGGVEEIITVTGWDPSAALNTALVLPNLALVLQVDAALGIAQTVDAATNLTGVEEIVIPLGVTLTMTADQFQQIQTSATVTGAGTLNITNLDSDNANIDLSTVTAQAGTITLDPAAGLITATVPELLVSNPIVLTPTAVLDNATGGKFSILMSANNQAITLSSETQADGRAVEEGAFTGNALVLGFTAADGTDADPYLVATDFNVDNVYVLNQYLANEFSGVTPANIELMLTDLDSGITVVIYDVDTALTGGLVNPGAVTSTLRTVTVESNTFVNAALAFNDIRPDVEVTVLTINLNGNSVINGNLTLPQNTDPMSLLPTNYVQLFQQLTINSVNNSGQPLVSPNRINGDIIANTALARPESTVEQFTIDLNGVSIVGWQEQIGFAGVVANLADGDTGIQVAATLAAEINAAFGVGSQPLWYAQDNGDGTVTFTALSAGAVTDVTVANFSFTQNHGSTVLATAIVPADITINQQGAFALGENNLLNVTINATHALVVPGVIEFSYVAGSQDIDSTADLTAIATLNVTGTADVTVGSVNTNDVDVTGLVFNNTNTGTILIPGTSPGAAVGNTETLVINNNGGTITFGTAGDPSKPGVSGATLSLIEVNGTGNVNLGVIALVDTAAPVLPATNSFYLDATANSGDVTATIGADLATGGVWSFANGLTGTLTLTINEDASFAAGSTLSIQGATITIDGDVDLSGVDLSGIVNDCEFFVPAGSTLTLSLTQIAFLSGLGGSMAITGEGTVEVVGEVDTDAAVALNLTLLQTVGVDLSGITNAGVIVPQANDINVTLYIPGATDDLAAAAGFNYVGTAFNEIVNGSNEDDVMSGGAGNDTLTGGFGSDTYNVTAGTDTINGLFADGTTDDVLVVSAGATAEAAGISSFVATADTVNNGTANLTMDLAGGVIDVSLAGGTSGFNLLGGVGADTLIGGANADVINGGGSTQVANPDTLTGNGGADAFFFNVGSSTPIQPGSVTTIAGVDREVISLTADGVDNGNEVFSITYILNGLVRVVTIDTTAGAYAGLDVSVADDVLTAIKSAFDGLPGGSGVTVTLDLAGDTATFTALNGAQLTVGNLALGAGTFDTLAGGSANGTDVPQESLVTLQAGALGTDFATVGETYRLGVTFTNGATNAIEYVVQAGDNFAAVAQQLDTLLTAQVGGGVTITANLDGTIDIVDANADNGGFTVSTSVISAVTGTGASNLGATDHTTADTITDFATTVDKVRFEGMANGSGTNYAEAAGVVDYATALTAANLAFDGTVRYYLTSVNDVVPGDGYGVLFFDANGDGGVDGVVKLLLVTQANFAFGDIGV